ncbi:hypothetical protein PAMP_016328 [Pampus punctatissimus]
MALCLLTETEIQGGREGAREMQGDDEKLGQGSNTIALTLCLSRRQVSRGHEGVGGPGCCSEQLKQTWAKKSWMASVGSASSTSLAASSFATTTTGYAPMEEKNEDNDWRPPQPLDKLQILICL